MKSYRPVCHFIWNDQKFPKLQHRSQLLWFFLFTHPLSGPIGTFKASLAGLHEELNRNGCWTRDEFDAALAELLGQGLIAIDRDAMVIAFPKFFQAANKPNHPVNPNQVKHWGKFYTELPDCELKFKCYQALEELLKGFDHAFLASFREGWGNPLPNPFGNPSRNHSTNGSLKPLVIVKEVVKDLVRVKEEFTPDQVVAAWNALGLRRVEKAGGHIRTRLLRQLVQHPDRQWWLALFARVQQSDFLAGRKTDFIATLDWVIGPKNLAKIEAGNYDNRGSPSDPLAQSMKAFLERGEERTV